MAKALHGIVVCVRICEELQILSIIYSVPVSLILSVTLIVPVGIIYYLEIFSGGGGVVVAPLGSLNFIILYVRFCFNI